MSRTCGGREPFYPRPSTLGPRLTSAFTLVEVMVSMALLSLIVLILMAVFNSTQTAFRSNLTQTDVLESGRAAMDLMNRDLEGLTPSFGSFGFSNAVNFYANTNRYQYQSNSGPLVQTLAASTALRTNVLQHFFILSRQNTTWTGVGYVVDTTSTTSINPLYRFYQTTNVQADNGPWWMFNAFTNGVATGAFTNMSHLLDGVVDLRVRAYDPNGYWMTNLVDVYVGRFTTNENSRFLTPSLPGLADVGFYMYSNTLPGSAEIQLGTLEDRVLRRAESIGSPLTQSNYLANHAGQVHLFRRRVVIRNVDLSAYQ